MAAPGLPTLTLAESALSNVSGNQTSLDIRNADLLSYLLAPMAIYTLSLSITEAVSAPTQLSVTPSFEVVASPL